MARAVAFLKQAKALLEFALPDDFIDPHVPPLAIIKSTALIAAHLLAQSGRQGVVPLRSQDGLIRCWFTADVATVQCWAIQVSYDGGRTFDDPVHRYT